MEQHEILKVELLREYDKDDKLNLTRLWNVVSNFEQPFIKIEDINEADGCSANHTKNISDSAQKETLKKLTITSARNPEVKETVYL